MNSKEFIEKLKTLGWTLKSNVPSDVYTPNDIINRIELNAQPEFLEFINQFEILANNEDNIWFLSVKDYSKDNLGEGFSWNEFELQSLEAADENQRDNILQFWKMHLPFLMGVKSGYAYVALVLVGPDKGSIVAGNEPEYEETTKIAESLEEFFDIYIPILNNEMNIPALNIIA